ncbi:hypothetical protein K8I28_01720 [bacterium]|nr:hypothetical protein [bacterium]
MTVLPGIKFRYILFFLLILFTFCDGYAQNWTSPQVRTFTTEEVGEAGQSWCALQDHRSLLYFGIRDGVLEFDGSSWRKIVFSEGATCYSLGLHPEGQIYTGSENEIGYLAPDKRGEMEYISLLDSLPENLRHWRDRIIDVTALADRILFLGDKFLLTYRKAQSTLIPSEDFYFSGLKLGDRYFVVDGRQGMLEYQDGQLAQVAGAEEVRSHVMIPYGREKGLVFSIANGPLVFDPSSNSENRFSQLDSTDLAFFLENEIVSAVSLKKGEFAVGTIKNGLAIFSRSGKLLLHLTRMDGLGSDDIYDLHQDVNGNIWLSTGAGISVVVPSGDIPGGVASAHADSTQVDEDDESVFRAIIRKVESTIDDSVLFGGAFYRQVYGATTLEQSEQQNLIFEYDYNAFRFTYSANFTEGNEPPEFQVFLDGSDRGWSSWSERTTREYTNLYWGKFTFHVRARNSQGTISEEATYSFRITPPWWETWWWYTAQIGLLFSLLAASVFFNRFKKSIAISTYLTSIFVLVVFEYIDVSIEPVIGIYSKGIAFFEVLMTLATGLILSPAQNWIRKLIRYLAGITDDHVEKRTADKLEKRIEQAEREMEKEGEESEES